MIGANNSCKTVNSTKEGISSNATISIFTSNKTSKNTKKEGNKKRLDHFVEIVN